MSSPPALPPNPTILPPELWRWVGESLHRHTEEFRIVKRSILDKFDPAGRLREKHQIYLYRGGRRDQPVVILSKHAMSEPPTRIDTERWLRDLRAYAEGKGGDPFCLGVAECLRIDVYFEEGEPFIRIYTWGEDSVALAYSEERLQMFADLIEQLARHYEYPNW